ncbi:longitudinals lacking protein, isoforms H/M/V isoform X3 [Plutella xylostella]|uniref:longitudinals lacking protein, isoforms H/M/V isoform X3 n=1 Tax=Plutella xylostella TaxID=51655 RepID=UPI00203269C0|nr:longitudinals lacking protein, isoforms H/M/V isoform X3 [Plutella xylostella]
MSIQQFCLRWNNHQPNFISVFTTLLNTESLVDVTLAAEGRHLQAHKVVLSACSVYFQTLFTENPSRHPIVILKDVKYSDLRIMVDFMYYGEVNVSQEQLPQVLETAKMLKIKGLTEMPESTSLTRSQGSISEFVSHNDEDQQRLSSSPCNSPSAKRRKFRRLSNGSQQPAMEAAGLEPARQDAVTLSSLPQRRYRDERAVDAQQQVQTEETPNNMHSDDPLLMETNPPGLSQGGQWNMMEHAYPRYSCVGGGAAAGATAGAAGGAVQDGMGGYMLNHMGLELGEYGAVQPSPGPSCADPPAPDPPAPAKRRRTSNPQAEENFQRALEAVRFGGIGFCKAARMFGVNNRTLWLEYKKKGYPNNRPSIKSRIKREHTTPPPETKDEQPAEQQLLVCPPHAAHAAHAVPVVGFIDSRPGDYPLHSLAHHSPINLHQLNFNTMQ